LGSFIIVLLKLQTYILVLVLEMFSSYT